MELFNFPEYNQPIGKINNLINDIIKVVINISTKKSAKFFQYLGIIRKDNR